MIHEFISNPLFNIVSAFTGYLIGNRLALSRDRIQNFNRAAEKLRDVFLPILLLLNPYHHTLKEDIYYILERNFDAHKGAVIEFSNHLRGRKTKRAFLQAWYEYHCYTNDCHGDLCLEQYMINDQGYTFKKKHEILKLIETRINKILKFAQPK